MEKKLFRINKKLKEKINEAFSSVLPITIIVLLISVLLVPTPIGTIMMFLVGAAMLIVGMGFFSLGADMAMMPIGEGMGKQFTKSGKLWLVIILCFGMGLLVTVAEPDLQVLAQQVTSVPSSVLILTVAVGVGLFLTVGMLRVLFKVSLSRLLIIFYILVFVIAAFTPNNFVSVAFDSGGVTTGPITVPFILALGMGIASMRGDKNAEDDSFGFVALCSVGPILAVLLLGIIYNPDEVGYAPVTLPDVVTTQDVVRQFMVELPVYFKEVFTALLPIAISFAVFQAATRRFKKLKLARIMVGFAYTYIGLVMFLTGVNVGFIPAGSLIGSDIASSSRKWLLIPLGMIIGYFIVAAEPAVHVLKKQVEEISGGAVPQTAIQQCLSIGVAISLGIAMLRVLAGISIFWFLIPGYTIALVLTFFVPKIFTGIAFDSGGVASGPMTSTFLLPFAIGACEASGGNVLTDAFGIVAMVAMTPLIALQLLGLAYMRKMKTAAAGEAADMAQADITDYEDSIIDYDGVETLLRR